MLLGKRVSDAFFNKFLDRVRDRSRGEVNGGVLRTIIEFDTTERLRLNFCHFLDRDF